MTAVTVVTAVLGCPLPIAVTVTLIPVSYTHLTLPEEKRKAILLYYFEGMNDTEIAELFLSLIHISDTVKLIYEHGEREIPAGQFFNGNPDYELGKFERFEAVPLSLIHISHRAGTLKGGFFHGI